MDCSTPGFLVHYQLPEFTQTHVDWVGDAISAISSSVIPFSSHLQSFPASGSFPVSQFFASGGQSIGASASASVLPMNIQDWFPLGSTSLILQFRRLSNSLPEKAVATHSSTLAWTIPWTEEPGGLLSKGSHRVGHDWHDLAAAAAATGAYRKTIKSLKEGEGRR